MNRYTVRIHCTNCTDEHWFLDNICYIADDNENEEESLRNIVDKYENKIHHCSNYIGKHFGLIKIDEIIKERD